MSAPDYLRDHRMRVAYDMLERSVSSARLPRASDIPTCRTSRPAFKRRFERTPSTISSRRRICKRCSFNVFQGSCQPGGPTKYAHAVKHRSTTLLSKQRLNAIHMSTGPLNIGHADQLGDDTDHRHTNATKKPRLLPSQKVCGAAHDFLTQSVPNQNALMASRVHKTATN